MNFFFVHILLGVHNVADTLAIEQNVAGCI